MKVKIFYREIANRTDFPDFQEDINTWISTRKIYVVSMQMSQLVLRTIGIGTTVILLYRESKGSKKDESQGIENA